jgi:hypothetical protein
LAWQYETSDVTVSGFIIYRSGGPLLSLGKRTAIERVPIDTVAGMISTYLDTDIAEEYTYTYGIVAYNISGATSDSGLVGGPSEVSITAPLKTPTGLTGVAQPTGKVSLAWTNNSTALAGFIIQRSKNSTTDYTEIARIGKDSTVYNDSNIQNSVQYYYRIAAYKNSLQSHSSNEISVIGDVTGISNLVLGIPDEFQLCQNFPNPFNPTTKIRFGLPTESTISITIYNILGAEVMTIFTGFRRAGYHEVVFNAGSLPSGMYVYQLRAGEFIQTKKMVLLK